MIYLSAQSDDNYYVWQLELQLYNFKSLGLKKAEIHILFGYDPNKGINENVIQLIEDYKEDASFFTYPDDHLTREYGSAIRPHLLAKHFQNHPKLAVEWIFYHDCDIIFRQLPQFDLLLQSENCCWLVSDARNYIGVNYLEKFGSHVIEQMAHAVGIAKEMIYKNDRNAGGAQYILLGTDALFWEKVELDAESLFLILIQHKYEQINNSIDPADSIQAWCADMWSLLWNAWNRGYKTRISAEMDFLWAYDPIVKWESKYIYHNTGEDRTINHFNKSNFTKSAPYFKDFSHIDPNTCSIRFTDLIKSFSSNYHKDISDVTFSFLFFNDSAERKENLNVVIRHLLRFFTTNIIVTEVGAKSVWTPEFGSSNIKHSFIYDSRKFLHQTRHSNTAIECIETPLVLIHDTDVLIAPDQIYQAVVQLRHEKADVCYPYDGSFIDVDATNRVKYINNGDFSFIELAAPSLRTRLKNSFGGAVLVNKQKFEQAGKENENIIGWGPEDIERYYRLKILNYRISRITGPLYHLHHPQTPSSAPSDSSQEVLNLKELIFVCNSTRTNLQHYVESWAWSKNFVKNKYE